MDFNDMRGYIELLKDKGLLLDLDIELNVARETTELQALMRHLHNHNGPALMLKLSSGQDRQMRGLRRPVGEFRQFPSLCVQIEKRPRCQIR